MDKAEVDCAARALLDEKKKPPYTKEELEKRYGEQYTKGQIERICHRYRYFLSGQE